MDIDIQCPHERDGISTGTTVSDYRPLTKQELYGLLLVAQGSSNNQTINKIQVRLAQAVYGVLCPRQIDGDVARRLLELDSLYVYTLRNHPAELATLAVVEKFYAILEPPSEGAKP